MHLLFFTFRTCSDQSQYYYPLNHSCLSDCPYNAIATPAGFSGNADYLLCNPCHYSCEVCTIGNNDTACSSCPTDSSRTQANSSCPCDDGYSDTGQVICVLCSEVMPGCVSCSSSTVCLDCDNITYVLNATSQTCTCGTGYYLVSGYCLSYSGCL